MFGYIKPYKPDMKIKEYELYKSVYCGVCKCLNKEFGILSKLFLSYDCAFLALFLMSLEDNEFMVRKEKCVCNCFKRCNFLDINDSIRFSSASLVIMTYYKILDDISDNRSLKKIIKYPLILFILEAYKKAKKLYPEVDNIVSFYVNEQRNVEGMMYGGLDKSADSTAGMLSNIVCLRIKDEKQRRIAKELFYFLGRWIYLIDAADDFDEDKKNSNFNPFLNEILDKNMSKSQNKEYMNSVLNQTVARIISTYSLLNIKNFKPILDNIILLGFGEMQRNVIFLKERARDERSI